MKIWKFDMKTPNSHPSGTDENLKKKVTVIWKIKAGIKITWIEAGIRVDKGVLWIGHTWLLNNSIYNNFGNMGNLEPIFSFVFEAPLF